MRSAGPVRRTPAALLLLLSAFVSASVFVSVLAFVSALAFASAFASAKSGLDQNIV